MKKWMGRAPFVRPAQREHWRIRRAVGASLFGYFWAMPKVTRLQAKLGGGRCGCLIDRHPLPSPLPSRERTDLRFAGTTNWIPGCAENDGNAGGGVGVRWLDSGSAFVSECGISFFVKAILNKG